MKYEVHRYGPGGMDIITVEADSGDEAAQKGYKVGTIVRGVHPITETPAEPKKRARLQGEDA